MAMKHVTGEFQFPAEFGFTGSTKGNDNARNHVFDPAGEEDRDPYPESYINRQQARRGGRIHKADGGDIKQETLSAPGTSFGSAFAAARRAALNGGPKTFQWNGKSYNTNLAPDAPARTSSGPGRKPSSDTSAPPSGPGRSPSGNTVPAMRSGPGRSPTGPDLPTPPIPPDYYDFSVTGKEAEDRNAQIDALRRAQNADDGTGLRRGGRVKKAMGGAMPGQAPMPPQQAGAMGAPPMAAQQGMQPGMLQGGAPSAPGPAAMSRGGDPMSNATISMPVHDAKRMAAGLMTAGRNIGAHQTVGALANAARQRLAGAQQPAGAAPPAMARGGHLDAAARHALPKSDFALPGERYPIPDANHARNALARVSGNGSPSEKSAVRSAVHRKFPGIGNK